ncbi:MAG: hypothetical protein JO102_02285, partial [Elusimicrobia bacterium]|nr:hypothetical protein [Elusimicrobiota bacterium]
MSGTPTDMAKISELTSIKVVAGSVVLRGDLTLPPNTSSLVLFAHGSGSSRLSPRNRFVARILNDSGVGTLLFDLLTEREDAADQADGHLRFDIPLLRDRLVGATDWVMKQAETKNLKIGYFGASTGAGAALQAAAVRVNVVKAVVSRGGRPDLAGPSLPLVKAPTLLIVGERDVDVLDMNRTAKSALG